ncbi:MAG: N-formylglutamate amidohydrolase [Pseudomonadota bacterium]
MRYPFVMSVPHCSYQIPGEIGSSFALTEKEILESTDMGTRELFAALPIRAALWARWSRLVVDLNRCPMQRDPKGVIPEEDYYKRKIYKDDCRPDEQAVERRLQGYYWPYHNRLRDALEDPEVKVLFDCHSLTGIGPAGAPDPFKWRKDIVLGNNGDHHGEIKPDFGMITCPGDILHMMKEAFVNFGFSVSINYPYSGGFITVHYGEKLALRGKMAVQIEINQELYLDNVRLHLKMDKLAEISKRLHHVFREISRQL